MKRVDLSKLIVIAFVATTTAAPLASSAPTPPRTVDLELVLATDNSQSIDRSEAMLQRQGIAAAFKHPEVVRAIQSGTYGRIAVAYIDWSSLPYSRLTLDWRIIGDKASADAFALRLTNDPKALIDLQVELARANVSDPDPPAWLHDLLGTHPTTVERIGAALSYER